MNAGRFVQEVLDFWGLYGVNHHVIENNVVQTKGGKYVIHIEVEFSGFWFDAYGTMDSDGNIMCCRYQIRMDTVKFESKDIDTIGNFIEKKVAEYVYGY